MAKASGAFDPALKPWATETEVRYIDAVNAAGSFRGAATALGVNKKTVDEALKRARRRAEAAAMEAFDAHGQDVAPAASSLGLAPPLFLHLLKVGQERQRQAALDPPGRKGFIARQVSTQYGEAGEYLGEWRQESPEGNTAPGGVDAGPERDGHTGYSVSGVSTLFDGSGRMRAQWVKTSKDAEQRWRLMEAHLAGARDVLERAEPIAGPERCDEDLLTIYPLGDPHCGLYVWEAETGTRFDLVEFERLNRAAIDRIVRSAPASPVAIFNDKGDSTHADNSKNRTPSSGHELDVHGRHAEVVRVSIRVKRYQIARLLEKHDLVIVRIDPGNHDLETALHQVLVLEALYEREPRVQVVTSPNPYWYYRFGANLIGTCHGDGAKPEQLPLLMATDVPQWWGETEFRIWLAGHVHHFSAKEYNGATVEHVRTLAPTDSHHHRKGYRSKRDLKAITLHRTDGEIERHTCPLKRIERVAA